jgi:hypothetical protein
MRWFLLYAILSTGSIVVRGFPPVLLSDFGSVGEFTYQDKYRYTVNMTIRATPLMICSLVVGIILNTVRYGIFDFQMSISKKAIDFKRNGEQTAIDQWPVAFRRDREMVLLLNRAVALCFGQELF